MKIFLLGLFAGLIISIDIACIIISNRKKDE